MGFNNLQTLALTIEHEDNEYVYFSIPPKTRVSKASGKIEKRMKAGWVEQTKFAPTVADKSNPRYPGALRFTRNVGYNHPVTFSAARVIATAVVPNPNNFTFVRMKDGNPGNLDPANLEWCERETMFENKCLNPFTDEEREALAKIPKPHISTNKEYMHFLNNRKDKDGLTKADRSRLRKQGKYPMSNTESPKDQKLVIDTGKDVTDRAMQVFLLSKPVYDPVTHLLKGYIMLTAEELEALLSQSTETDEVKQRARELLVDIAKGIMVEACKSDATINAVRGLSNGSKRDASGPHNGANQ